MANRILCKETTINRPVEEVFEFFSKADNLNLLTPTHLHFNIITPLPIIMQQGALIDYKLSLLGFPIKWRTEITTWEPPYRFVDVQLKGPYKVWVHEHIFERKSANTIMYDKVEFLSPGWFLEPLIHHLFVKNNLKDIFDYREKQIKTLFK